MVLLIYSSDFQRTLEMQLINYEISFILIWSENLVFSNALNQTATFAITETKLYVPVVTLSTQYNAKLLQQLKLGLKRTINWNKCQSKITTEAVNWYLDFLIDPSFQGVNRLVVLLFENGNDKTWYFPQAAEIKDYNVMIERQQFFEKLVKIKLKTYDSILKFETGQGDDYITGCLLDYKYFNKSIIR